MKHKRNNQVKNSNGGVAVYERTKAVDEQVSWGTSWVSQWVIDGPNGQEALSPPVKYQCQDNIVGIMKSPTPNNTSLSNFQIRPVSIG